MRDIKFRIFLKDTGRYINEGVDIGMLSLPKNWETYFILEQYTGLKDKNGVEIYEGDKLKSGENIMTVSWCNEMATFCLNKKGWMYSHFFKEGCEAEESEIIGNIHEQ